MEGKEGKLKSKEKLRLILFSLSSRRKKRHRIGRKRKKEGDWDSLSRFSPRPLLPFLRLPGRLYFGIQPIIMLGEHLKTRIC